MRKDQEDIELLVSYLKGKLDKAATEQVETRLRTSAEFKRMYELVADLHRKGINPETAIMADSAKKLSMRMIRDHLKNAASKFVQGVTIYDSGVLPLPEGVRPATVDTRQIRYRVGACDVELSLYPVTPSSYELIGHISSDRPDRKFEISVKAGRKTSKTTTDKHEIFRFARLDVDKYVMVIRSEGEEIGRIDLDL